MVQDQSKDISAHIDFKSNAVSNDTFSCFVNSSKSKQSFIQFPTWVDYRSCSSLSLTVITKGIVALAINFLGIVLIYGGVVIPSFELAMVGQVYYKAAIGNITENALFSGSHGLFVLGLSMIIFSFIIGYKPTVLYTKNRPAPMEAYWSKYPIWHKELQWAAIKNGSLVKLPLLMNAKDRYLLWRYAYVLVLINDTLFLVPINSFVPSNSMLMRDDLSGKLVGVDKYIGYFA